MSSSHNEIWMTIENDDGTMKEGFKFPCNPDSYVLTSGTNEKTVDIAGLGSVTVKKGKSPLSIQFSGHFPFAPEPDMEVDQEDLKSPMEYDALIQKWKDGTAPVHLLITNTNVNAYFTISQYQASEEGGDIGTIHYTIVLKQYGSGIGGSADGSAGTGSGMVRTVDVDPYVTPSVPDTYIVQKKDTLQSIAKHFYGDSQMAYEIYKLNTKKLKKGVNTKLKKKWVLYLPQATD